MFLSNKYTKLYYNIINNAKSNGRIKRRSTHKQYVYYELHHIIPKSLNGGDDDDNLVLLTAREHFLCHYLLCKMLPKNSQEWHKLVRAFTFMYSSSAKQNRYINSRLYESARQNIGKIMSASQSGKGNSQFGTTWVSHIQKRRCCKINTNDLDEYLENGYIQKRIISWDAYDRKQQQKYDNQKAKIYKSIDKINNKILSLELEKESLLKSLAEYKC